MRCYRIEGGGRKRYAGTAADARQTRDDIMEETGVKKKDVSINEDEVPDDKAGKLQFINELCAELDPPKPGKSKGKPEPEDNEEEE